MQISVVYKTVQIHPPAFLVGFEDLVNFLETGLPIHLLSDLVIFPVEVCWFGLVLLVEFLLNIVLTLNSDAHSV